MLYIRSSELIHLITESLYPFNNIFPSPFLPPHNHFYSLLLWIWLFFLSDPHIRSAHPHMWYHTVFVFFLSGIFHLAYSLPSSSMVQMIGFSLLWPSNISLYIYHVFLIHSYTSGHSVISISWLLWIMLWLMWGGRYFFMIVPSFPLDEYQNDNGWIIW